MTIEYRPAYFTSDGNHFKNHEEAEKYELKQELINTLNYDNLASKDAIEIIIDRLIKIYAVVKK